MKDLSNACLSYSVEFVKSIWSVGGTTVPARIVLKTGGGLPRDLWGEASPNSTLHTAQTAGVETLAQGFALV